MDAPRRRIYFFQRFFFTDPRVEVSLDDFFSFDRDALLEKVTSRQIEQVPVKIERYISEEEGKEINFRVFHTGGSVVCGHLVWGYSPVGLMKLCPDKRIFGKEAIWDHFSGREAHALYIKFKLSKKVSDRRETLFLPLSYTHSWGHFIGEFQERDDGQEIEFVTFLDKDQTNEEEIIRKIRILKRSLEKVHPGLKKLIKKEEICLDEVSLDFSDNLFDQISSLDYINFVGQAAPMNQANRDLSHLARGLEGLRLMEEGLAK